MIFTHKQLKDILNEIEMKEFLFAYELLQKDKTIKKIEITKNHIYIEREFDMKDLDSNNNDDSELNLDLELK